MPTTDSRADLDIQVRAHVLANPAIYEQAGRNIDTTYSPEAFWQDDLAFYKSQPSYPVEDYPTLDQWRSAAKRAPLVVSRMLEHHRYDRGIPPADEAARVVLFHWVLTDQACNSAPVKLTAFQDWSIASIEHDLARAYAYDIADNAEWREYVCKALAVMQSQSAMAGTKPVPIQGVIWHNPSAPAPALKDAFDRYWQTLDAATVPAGDDRRIPEDAGAVLLSEVTQSLHDALAAEHNRLIMAHGREIDPPDQIQLWKSHYPDGRDATPIPRSAVKVRTMDLGRDGADAGLMTAIERARNATACPVERHNAQNAIKPGGPHRRYFAGDVIRRDTLDALESVGKLLRLNDNANGENESSQLPMVDLPMLSPKASAVYELLLQLPEHRAMTGPQIVDALPMEAAMDESTLRKSIVPALKPYGLEHIAKVGYRIKPSKRPPSKVSD